MRTTSFVALYAAICARTSSIHPQASQMSNFSHTFTFASSHHFYFFNVLHSLKVCFQKIYKLVLIAQPLNTTYLFSKYWPFQRFSTADYNSFYFMLKMGRSL